MTGEQNNMRVMLMEGNRQGASKMISQYSLALLDATPLLPPLGAKVHDDEVPESLPMDHLDEMQIVDELIMKSNQLSIQGLSVFMLRFSEVIASKKGMMP